MNEICVNSNDQRQYDSGVLLAPDSWLDFEKEILGYETEWVGYQQVQTLHWRWNNEAVRVYNMNLFSDNFENRFPLLEEQGGYLEIPQ